jgi:hypothetical protein
MKGEKDASSAGCFVLCALCFELCALCFVSFSPDFSLGTPWPNKKRNPLKGFSPPRDHSGFATLGRERVVDASPSLRRLFISSVAFSAASAT